MTTFDPDAHIDSASPAVGLTIDPAYREGVKRFLLLAAEMADALNEADLAPNKQAHAPVFTPPKPTQ
ncbi:MAG: DUF4089 domain-containing protein [Pseudomonadota bacterium]